MLILFSCFIEGHKFISLFITVTCLPSLNKGVTLTYLTYQAWPDKHSQDIKEQALARRFDCVLIVTNAGQVSLMFLSKRLAYFSMVK